MEITSEQNKKKYFFLRLIPFALTVFIIAFDQITKYFVTKAGPPNSVIKDVFGNDLLWIWHVRNPFIAFSLGSNVPEMLRPILFIVFPLIVLVFLGIFYWRSTDLTNLQRWTITGIIGGGAGNLIDRICRPDGVVDFISVKFFGLFGCDRFPTFNVADASVVICVFLWLFTIIFAPKPKSAD
ncbi:MAG: signal peptidase II [Spirochaetaceae bacterium]|jgi:signal peptidase II|nr:signal peptidase II [Spirochaetaceae bacterium]